MTQDLLSPAAIFDAWAQVYDEQPNPLLALEERALTPMLPEVRGWDILDSGCGTGRWLSRLAQGSPRRLVGIDLSEQMLATARRKVPTSELRRGICTDLPVEDESADLVLSSFVLSYVDDLVAYARELARVLRPGGTCFLSDMHPETEELLGWKRSFRADGNQATLPSQHWPLARIAETLSRQGLLLRAQCEPSFGPEEEQLFAQNGKLASFVEIQSHPAIYIFKWRKPLSASRRRIPVRKEDRMLTLRGARCAGGPERAEARDISIVSGRIHTIEEPGPAPASPGAELDLSGCMVLPGLINAHDHLEFGLFPRLGDGPYANAVQWAEDIHRRHGEEIARLRTVPRSVALLCGAIRNLLCGVTTVCHHNPLHPELLEAGFPIRVVRDFGWAHSLAFEPELAHKLEESAPGRPFIVHAAEGIDDASAREVWLLDELQALNDRTLLVHGLACDERAVALINQRQAGIILCPTSNEFLFRRSPRKEWVESVGSVLLGSDSPLTAAGDLLDEIRFAHEQVGIDPAALYRMVTAKAARALRLRDGAGTVAPGALADLLVVRDTGAMPAEALIQTNRSNVEFVMLGGRVHLASDAGMRRLPLALAQGLEPLEVEGQRYWLRAPVRELVTTAEQYLGGGLRIGGKRVRYAA